MTPEEIRAEVTERLARADYMMDRDTIPDMLGMPQPLPVWEDATDAVQEEHRRFVTHLVDALGDMIPTGRQWAARYPGDVITRGTSIVRANVEKLRTANNDVTIESQWTHDWQEDPA